MLEVDHPEFTKQKLEDSILASVLYVGFSNCFKSLKLN